MHVANVGESSLSFLKWNTPFDENHPSNFFDIRDPAGNRAVYIGRIAKRGPPALEEFVEVAAGATVTHKVDIAELYRLPHGNTTYNVTFVGVVLATGRPLEELAKDARPDVGFDYRHVDLESLEVADVVFSSFELFILTPLLHSPPAPPVMTPGLLGAISYTSSCSGKESGLVSVVATAKSMTQSCVNYLTASTCDKQFVQWFGRYTGSSRWAAVTQNFQRINNKLGSNVFGLDCAGPQCSQGVFAYVYPTDSTFTVHLCGAFWTASPSISYDSKPGTIIHEMSHFSPLAGTQDHTYGTSGAQDFAARQADKAVNNADNHEYFSESSPRC